MGWVAGWRGSAISWVFMIPQPAGSGSVFHSPPAHTLQLLSHLFFFILLLQNFQTLGGGGESGMGQVYYYSIMQQCTRGSKNKKGGEKCSHSCQHTTENHCSWGAEVWGLSENPFGTTLLLLLSCQSVQAWAVPPACQVPSAAHTRLVPTLNVLAPPLCFKVSGSLEEGSMQSWQDRLHNGGVGCCGKQVGNPYPLSGKTREQNAQGKEGCTFLREFKKEGRKEGAA